MLKILRLCVSPKTISKIRSGKNFNYVGKRQGAKGLNNNLLLRRKKIKDFQQVHILKAKILCIYVV
ncbi:hypothetical protein H5J24_23170 [Chryseobacterium capnotolerans]|uniref:hypothetical protein n=1 Tax=Chryseobacterium TaxID=59732 RepID=UPI00083B9AFB|nr:MULTISPECIES: hypothetical protein [Chryseobacterium]UHO38390.1 hypothetical protein H5J24_23170 [Chryseobacterium capnotolerans]